MLKTLVDAILKERMYESIRNNIEKLMTINDAISFREYIKN